MGEFIIGLGHDTDIFDSGNLRPVHDLGNRSKGDFFISAKINHGQGRVFNLFLEGDSSSLISMGSSLGIAFAPDQCSPGSAPDQFLYGFGFRDIDFNARLNDGRCSMKMINSTKTTSTRGNILISDKRQLGSSLRIRKCHNSLRKSSFH